MKIKTKLLFITGFSTLAIIVLSIFLYRSFQPFNLAIEKNKIANQIVTGVFERRVLSDEYLFYHEDRPREQWLAKNDQITTFLKSQSAKFSKDSEKEIINNLFKELDESQKIFSELVALQVGSGTSGADTETIKKDQEVRLSAQLLINAQETISTVNQLAKISLLTATATTTATAQILAGLIAALILVVVTTVSLLWKSIVGPITKLHKGTEIIGEGNLDYKVEVKSKDEIGQLGRAFNAMTANLKVSVKKREDVRKELAVTAEKLKISYETLDKKIIERTKDLQRAKAQNEAILFSIGDAVMACDTGGAVMLFNGVAEKLTGFSVKDIVGHHYSQALKFVRESDEKTGDDFIAKAITTGQAAKMKNHTLLITKSGQKIPVADSAAPIKNVQGEIVGCVVVFRDITKEREIDKSKTEFVSLASHQLRTPLTSIKWYSEMLLGGDAGKLTSKQKIYIGELYQGNERMIDLVRNLLNVSRIEMGALAVNPKPIDIGELIKKVIKEQSPFVKEKKHKVVVEIPEGLPKISTDSELVRMIFQNLFGNAIEYMPPEGRITCTAEKKDNEIIIGVKDTGIGIPEKQQNQIFQKLFRGDNAVKEHSGGTGLELYITKAMVDALSGKIWFKSKEGEGTTFWVALPLKGPKNHPGQKIIDNHYDQNK